MYPIRPSAAMTGPTGKRVLAAVKPAKPIADMTPAEIKGVRSGAGAPATVKKERAAIHRLAMYLHTVG